MATPLCTSTDPTRVAAESERARALQLGSMEYQLLHPVTAPATYEAAPAPASTRAPAPSSLIARLPPSRSHRQSPSPFTAKSSKQLSLPASSSLLAALTEECSPRITAAELGISESVLEYISRESCAAQILLFLGGILHPASQTLRFAYVSLFAISFWSCGAVCFLNIIVKDVPYFTFPVDVLTAYVHVPAFTGFLLWRRLIKAPHVLMLIENIRKADPDRLAKVSARYSPDSLGDEEVHQVGVLLLKRGPPIFLALTVGMTGLVLAAYALPANFPMTPPLTDGTREDVPVTNFMFWHGVIMWAMVTPVIGSLLCTFGLLGFVGALHYADFVNARNSITRRLAKVTCPLVELTSAQFDAWLVLMEDYLETAQERLDASCGAWGTLNQHLLLFAWCQTLVIAQEYADHVASANASAATTSYFLRYYHVLQAIFHFVAGVVLVAFNLGLGWLVSRTCEKVKVELAAACKAAGASPTQVLLLHAQLHKSVRGYTTWGMVVNTEMIVAYTWAYLVTLFSVFIADVEG